ncbi:MAG: hypothetical protein JW731_14685 [Bacteroidales bacterium]|nr:hypothetical protein [Bacteroidales bacterium]
MKTLTLIVLAIMVGLGTMAQDDQGKSPQEYKTLFGSDKITHGGYGGILFGYSQIDNKDAFLIGAQGAWIINHGVGLGIAGRGFVNDLKFEKNLIGVSQDYNLVGGYGGLLIEPIIGARYPVHVSIPVIIGAGGVAYVRHYYYSNGDDNNYNYDYSDDASAFFVIEPGLEIELNMVKFMRFAIGGYYRYTSNLSLADTESDVLNGFTFGASLKFGKF